MTEYGYIVVVKKNGKDGPQFPVKGKTCVLGRDPECDIRIQLPGVSKHHTEIFVDEKDQIWIKNRSFKTCTVLNGNQLSDQLPLNTNDVFEIDGRQFRWQGVERKPLVVDLSDLPATTTSDKPVKSPKSASKRRSTRVDRENANSNIAATENTATETAPTTTTTTPKSSRKSLKKARASVAAPQQQQQEQQPEPVVEQPQQVQPLAVVEAPVAAAPTTTSPPAPLRRRDSARIIELYRQKLEEEYPRCDTDDEQLSQHEVAHTVQPTETTGPRTSGGFLTSLKRLSARLSGALFSKPAEETTTAAVTESTEAESAAVEEAPVQDEAAVAAEADNMEVDTVEVQDTTTPQQQEVEEEEEETAQQPQVVRQTMPTPLRQSIQSKANRSVVPPVSAAPVLPTPVRKQIRARIPAARPEAKSALNTPLRRAIVATARSKVPRPAPQKVLTDELKTQIEKQPPRAVVPPPPQVLTQQLKQEIVSRPPVVHHEVKSVLPAEMKKELLREQQATVAAVRSKAVKNVMPTPVKKAIKAASALVTKAPVEVKKPLTTPLKKQLRAAVASKPTVQVAPPKVLPTPVRKAIKNQAPRAQPVVKPISQDLSKAIRSHPLPNKPREQLRTAPTPLRKAIGKFDKNQLKSLPVQQIEEETTDVKEEEEVVVEEEEQEEEEVNPIRKAPVFEEGPTEQLRKFFSAGTASSSSSSSSSSTTTDFKTESQRLIDAMFAQEDVEDTDEEEENVAEETQVATSTVTDDIVEEEEQEDDQEEEEVPAVEQATPVVEHQTTDAAVVPVPENVTGKRTFTAASLPTSSEEPASKKCATERKVRKLGTPLNALKLNERRARRRASDVMLKKSSQRTQSTSKMVNSAVVISSETTTTTVARAKPGAQTPAPARVAPRPAVAKTRKSLPGHVLLQDLQQVLEEDEEAIEEETREKVEAVVHALDALQSNRKLDEEARDELVTNLVDLVRTPTHALPASARKSFSALTELLSKTPLQAGATITETAEAPQIAVAEEQVEAVAMETEVPQEEEVAAVEVEATALPRLPSPLRNAIVQHPGVEQREPARTAPTPLRRSIRTRAAQPRPELKKALNTPTRAAIRARPPRQAAPTMPADLMDDLRRTVADRAAQRVPVVGELKALATPMRKQIVQGVPLRHVEPATVAAAPVAAEEPNPTLLDGLQDLHQLTESVARSIEQQANDHVTQTLQRLQQEASGVPVEPVVSAAAAKSSPLRVTDAELRQAKVDVINMIRDSVVDRLAEVMQATDAADVETKEETAAVAVEEEPVVESVSAVENQQETGVVTAAVEPAVEAAAPVATTPAKPPGNFIVNSIKRLSGRLSGLFSRRTSTTEAPATSTNTTSSTEESSNVTVSASTEESPVEVSEATPAVETVVAEATAPAVEVKVDAPAVETREETVEEPTETEAPRRTRRGAAARTAAKPAATGRGRKRKAVEQLEKEVAEVVAVPEIAAVQQPVEAPQPAVADDEPVVEEQKDEETVKPTRGKRTRARSQAPSAIETSTPPTRRRRLARDKAVDVPAEEPVVAVVEPVVESAASPVAAAAPAPAPTTKPRGRGRRATKVTAEVEAPAPSSPTQEVTQEQDVAEAPTTGTRNTRRTRGKTPAPAAVVAPKSGRGRGRKAAAAVEAEASVAMEEAVEEKKAAVIEEPVVEAPATGGRKRRRVAASKPAAEEPVVVEEPVAAAPRATRRGRTARKAEAEVTEEEQSVEEEEEEVVSTRSARSRSTYAGKRTTAAAKSRARPTRGRGAKKTEETEETEEAEEADTTAETTRRSTRRRK